MEKSFSWNCPKCKSLNIENIHPEDGPFISYLCENCGSDTPVEMLENDYEN